MVIHIKKETKQLIKATLKDKDIIGLTTITIGTILFLFNQIAILIILAGFIILIKPILRDFT